MDIPSVHDLLRSGDPFLPFSEFSIHNTYELSRGNDHEWMERRLQEGKPFVIRGFDKLDTWNKRVLSNETLINLSSSESLPVINCQSTRDVRMKLADLLLSQTEHVRGSNTREFLYAKDLQCPNVWNKALEAVLPASLRHLGSLDLFRVLPKGISPEVQMAYAGTRGSFSGFHRCFSGTVALNLMIESQGLRAGSICFGTDRHSQAKYDAFMEELGKSSHTDWANVTISQLRSADFPIYVTYQEPGDLVVFPSATSHQVWNIGPLVTRIVWNIMHSSSLISFFDYVQPVYRKLCHADTGRVPLIPLHALKACDRLGQGDTRLLLQIFEQLVDDEHTGSSVPIKLVDTQGAVVECNFCGLTIWNRHLHCEQCGDFDLCLTCFVSGRSCKHVTDYTWAELIPRETCQSIINATRNFLGDPPALNSRLSEQKPLGLLAVVAADARRQPAERLCHLCRDSHTVWKGITCSQCAAFFCFRGLRRHFDIDLIPLLRKVDPWACPKCSRICNCRCCHFDRPHQSKEKPVRARVKPLDPRGRIMGFVDNVFDQKRGKRASLAPQAPLTEGAVPPRGRKRLRLPSSDDFEQASSSCSERVSTGPTGSCQVEADEIKNAEVSRPNGRPTDMIFNGNPGFKGQLRICDLVESTQTTESDESLRSCPVEYRPAPASLDVSNRRDNESRETASGVSSPMGEESIPALEKKLEALRRYAGDLLELSLVDSHAKLFERIAALEKQIEQCRRRKAEMLFRNLHRDFPDLANIAMEEARRRGL